MFKFFRHLKYKKMVRVSASFILEELASIINDAIEHFGMTGQIRSPEHKEILKFESTSFLFWLFQKTNIFPDLWHKLILDEMHNQYFSRLKKHGYDSKAVQLVCNDFNERYKAYNDAFREDNDLSRIGARFISFATQRARTDWDAMDMLIPLYLIQKVSPKFEEWKKVLVQNDISNSRQA